MLAYHQLVFLEIHDESLPLIDADVAAVHAQRNRFWSDPSRQGEWLGQAAWNHLHDYLEDVEDRIGEIAELHTHYFWVHLYRRVGLGLHPNLDNSKSPRTLSLVRNIMEVAFTRYGLLDHERGDMGHASTLELSDVAGGLLEKKVVKLLGKGSAKLSRFEEHFRTSNNWVLRDFTIEDYVRIYKLEALAYEYWLTTARLRRVGKGCSIIVGDDGDVRIGDAGGDDLEWLIQHYDTQTDGRPFDTTALGVAFRGLKKTTPGHLPAVTAGYNVEGHMWKDICWDPVVKDQSLRTNFFLSSSDLDAFYQAHQFATDAFAAKRGFQLSSLLGFLSAIGVLELGSMISRDDDLLRLQLLLHFFQRAYIVNTKGTYFEALTEAAHELVCNWLGSDRSCVAADALKILDFLTLTPDKRRGRGLWSLGPRYTFVPYERATIVDLQGVVAILRNLFFGIRLDNGPKGPQFEDFFRAFASSKSLDVLPERELRTANGKSREVDAAIRKGTTLFVCECRAMEKPLDLEISRPKSLSVRIADLDDKLSQARSLADFVGAHPRGKNYDFSWATRVEPLVVSPFVEWVWTRAPELWLTDGVSRVLSFSEAVNAIETAV